MMRPEDRKSAAQLASDVNADVGLECRKCGCRDFRVYYTRPKDGFIMRRRRCRNCGTLITTYEK